MKELIKLVTKYSLILALSVLTGNVWFHLQMLFIPADNINYLDFWHTVPVYSGYFFQILVAILLFFDVKKYGLKYYLIPVVGLFYPLLGVCTLLILKIYDESKRREYENIKPNHADRE